MTSAGKLTTKAIAVIIIVAMLDAVGLSPVLMVLVTGVVFMVWLFARCAQAREVERIFDIYVTKAAGDNRGAGLGLPLSRRLARLLGGELLAVSRPQRGGCFILELPASAAGEETFTKASAGP